MSFLDQLQKASAEGQAHVQAQRQAEYAEQQRIMAERQQRYQFIKSLIDDNINSRFPSQESLLEYARTHEEKKLMIFEIKHDGIYIEGKKLPWSLSNNPPIYINSTDFDEVHSESIPYFDSSMHDPLAGDIGYLAPNIRYIYACLKNKTIDGLGTPKFDDAHMELWYEW